MADGGAWQSGVVDNGRGFQNTAAAPTAPVPGVPAVMYNVPGSVAASKNSAHLVVISIVLRVACIVFSVVAFAVIASNQGSYVVPSGYYAYRIYIFWWKAINSSNLAYLLAINVIVCAYSIVQLILSIVNSCTGKPVLAAPTKPGSIITFVCDQALTYMLMAGCGAGAAMSVNLAKGESGGLACDDGFRVLCDKNAASVAMSFIAFVCLALSCGMAYYRLFKMARI